MQVTFVGAGSRVKATLHLSTKVIYVSIIVVLFAHKEDTVQHSYILTVHLSLQNKSVGMSNIFSSFVNDYFVTIGQDNNAGKRRRESFDLKLLYQLKG